MKNVTARFALLSILLVVVFIGISSFSSRSLDLKEFKIEIEGTENGLKLVGQKGTAFKELTLTLPDDVQQGIDEFGMTITEAKKNTNDDNLADFEFTIQKINKEYVLIGKKGTAWSKLSFIFSSNNRAIVDQYGVIVK